jgi:hypothetical protein
MKLPRKGQVWRHKSLESDSKDNSFLVVQRRANEVSYRNANREEEPTRMDVKQFSKDFELVTK